jgi:hypothetical protein
MEKFLVILIILLSACIVLDVMNFKMKKENFIVLNHEITVPANCPNYLYTDNINYYLYNSRLPVNGITNPVRFNTFKEAKAQLDNAKCPDIPYVNLEVKKNKDDPTVDYERDCNNRIAPFNYLFNKQVADAGDNIPKIREYQKMAEREQVNFDLETCMIDRINKENPHLAINNTDLNYINDYDSIQGLNNLSSFNNYL